MTVEAFTETFTKAADATPLYARHYAAVGQERGLPIVCLHGLTRNSRDFELLAPWLASRGRRVIVPDMRGRGQSGWSSDPRRYVPAVYARDVGSQVEELGVRRAVFIGTSMGGLITMALAMQRNALVAAAVLNDVGPEIAPEGLKRISGYVGEQRSIDSYEDAMEYVRQVAGPALPDPDDDALEMIVRRLFRMDGPVPVLDYDPAISVALSDGKTAPRWLSWLIYRWLARRPLLLIRGEQSDILSKEIARRMLRRGRHTTMVQIPRIGHAPSLDEVEAREAIEAWLRTVP